jgi:hypothetical protein
VFRYWVARASDPLSPKAVLPDLDAARRAVSHYEEAFLRQREQQGPLREGYVRDVCRSFAGQNVNGRRFGAPGRHIRLPRVSTVERIVAFDEPGEVFGKSSEVGLDLHFGDDEVWLAEVRDRRQRASAAEEARRLAVYFSALRDVGSIRRGGRNSGRLPWKNEV